MQKDIKEWTQNDLHCLFAKVQLHNEALIGSFETPIARFSHVRDDILGPVPPSKNYRHILTIVDRLTRWPKAIRLVIYYT